MSITKQEIRTKLIDHIDSAPGLYGQDGLRLVGEFMEHEKICPQAIIEVIHDLRDEDYRFLDGRAIIPCIGATIPASEEFDLQVWAQKHLHTGGIKCVPGGL